MAYIQHAEEAITETNEGLNPLCFMQHLYELCKYIKHTEISWTCSTQEKQAYYIFCIAILLLEVTNGFYKHLLQPPEIQYNFIIVTFNAIYFSFLLGFFRVSQSWRFLTHVFRSYGLETFMTKEPLKVPQIEGYDELNKTIIMKLYLKYYIIR
jgi:hypothetical protein